MYNRIALVSLVIFIMAHYANCQNIEGIINTNLPLRLKVDSINALIKLDPYSNINSKILALRKLYQISDQSNFEYGKSQSLAMIGTLHWYKGKLDSALILYKSAYSISSKLADLELASKHLSNIGSVYSTLGCYDKALNYYHRGIEIDLKRKDTSSLSSKYSNIAALFLYLGNHTQSLEYARKSLLLAESVGYKEVLASSLINVGINLSSMNKKDSALSYIKRSLGIYSLDKNYSGISNCLQNIGNIYSDLKQYDSALIFFDNAIEANGKVGNQAVLSSILTNKGVLLNRMGDNSNALIILNEGYRLAKLTQYLTFETESARMLAKVHSDLGDYRKAFDYYNIYDLLRDSLHSIEIQSKVSNVEFVLKIEQLEKENKLREATIEKSSNLIIFLVVLSSIILLLALLLFVSIRNLQKANKSLKELNSTRDKFFSIIAHDLRNPLSAMRDSINSLKQNYYEIEEKEKIDEISSIATYSDNVYRLLENLLEWARTQTGKINFNPQVIDLGIIAETNTQLFLNAANLKGIHLVNSIEKQCTAFADANMITTVLRNLISNAVKFSKSGSKVLIFATEFSDEITVTVQDEGVGMDEETKNKLFKENIQSIDGTENEKGTGLGLLLCKEFIIHNRGKFFVKSQLGQGSQFSFSIPKNSK